ncbi:hypothetical protein BGZ51_000010 [Haplosporangium sp. Z 767]|nr:hypothetical protein BGZ51_000010 [Haplosporangium sp. Z 767]
MSTSAPRPVKGLTHEQRYSLCLKKQQCPTMRQSELAAWFKEKYAFGISQPTVSHSLKKSAEILAIGISAPGIEPTRVRNRPVRHPELELALYQWVRAREQEYQQKQKTGFEQPSGSNVMNTEMAIPLEPITGPALFRQAQKIALELNIRDIVFCPGWLARFKARYGIKHGRTTHSIQSGLSPPSTGSITANSSPSPSPPVEPMVSSIITPASTPLDSLDSYVRPSISVPANIDHSHISLQTQQYQQQQLHQQPQQPQPHESQHTHLTLLNIQPPSTTGSSTTLNLDFLHSIPITASPPSDTFKLEGSPISNSFVHSSPLPSSPLLHNQVSLSRAGTPNPAFHTTGLDSNAPCMEQPANAILSNILVHSDQDAELVLLQLRQYVESHIQEPSRALESLRTLENELRSLQEAQRLVLQLRQYMGLRFRDSIKVLESLGTLERALKPTWTRGSIIIAKSEEE